LGTIFGRHPAVVDGLGAVVRSPGAPRGSLVTFVCRMLTVGGGPIASGPVEIACRVITRFGLSVAQPGRDVTALRRQTGLTTAHSCQLVGPGVVAVRFGLSVALLGLPVADVRSKIAVAPFDVTLARRCQGVLILTSPAAVLICECHVGCYTVGRSA
ncbi:MAG TPA: hypothetical protein DCK96_03465, partial [Chloroflexi bacterium]|nr:hypothetical protein [Chloroflexota bacterium]